MLVGEQPGDREDVAGHPFVGPAGRLLDEALDEAGIERERVFVTNVVKHFKWRPSGKRRLHERPNPVEIQACRPWLNLELELVRPDVLVLMGATAAQALLGRDFKVTERHGELLPPIEVPGPRLIATFHPSSILRSQSSEERDAVVNAAFARGLLLLGAGKNSIRFSPPLVLTRQQADTAVRIFDEALSEVEQRRR